MVCLVKLLWALVKDCFRSQDQLKAENTALRHQLNVLQRQAPKRPQLSGSDRAFFVWLSRLFPSVAGAITIVRPETVIRWHREGFWAWWRWKSRNLGGRPKVERELRDLIRCTCQETHFGARRVFMASCSSSALQSHNRQFRNTCSKDEGRLRKAERPFCAITRMGLRL